MDKNFGGVAWTNHALTRLKERNISQSDAWAVWARPDSSRYAESKGAWVYYKTYGTQKIEVVAKKDERGKWLILSVWSRQMDGRDNYGSKKTESFIQFLLKRFFAKN